MSVPLVEFLRARLDEDEEVARATHRNEQFVYGTDRWFASHGNAITSMAPHRAVAEVESKRRILDACALPRVEMTGLGDAERWFVPGEGAPWAEPVLRLLALPYSGHRDYRAEWAPDLG